MGKGKAKKQQKQAKQRQDKRDASSDVDIDAAVDARLDAEGKKLLEAIQEENYAEKHARKAATLGISCRQVMALLGLAILIGGILGGGYGYYRTSASNDTHDGTTGNSPCRQVMKTILSEPFIANVSALFDAALMTDEFHPVQVGVATAGFLKVLFKQLGLVMRQFPTSLTREQRMEHEAEAMQHLLLGHMIPEYNQAIRDQECFRIVQEAVFNTGMQAPISYMATFFSAVDSSVEAVRRQNLQQTQSTNPPHTDRVRNVIIGAGPVGLLNAITAYKSAVQVIVVEKRSNYTRDIWFDLYPAPWYPSIDVLAQLGIFFQKASIHQQENDATVLSLRARVLEAFLSKVVMLLGIEVRYGTEFLGICTFQGSYHALLANATVAAAPLEGVDIPACDSSLGMEARDIAPFDVLTGSDGPYSRVRKAVPFEWRRQTTFTHPPRIVTANETAPEKEEEKEKEEGKKEHSVPELEQVSLIIGFQPRNATHCPAINLSADPWTVGHSSTSIASVFPRFYHGICHLQILLSHARGKLVLEQLEQVLAQHGQPQDAVPWSLVLEAANVHLTDASFDSIAALKKQVARLPDSEQLDAQIVPIRISAANRVHHVLLSGAHPPTTAKEEEVRDEDEADGDTEEIILSSKDHAVRPAVVMLAGDALMLANYRLGVGINSAFKDLPSTERFLTGLAMRGPMWLEDAQKLEAMVEKREAELQNVLRSRLDFQLSAIFYEAYCHLVVFFDDNEADVAHSGRVHFRASNSTYKPVPSRMDLLTKHCLI